ncbi:alpha/beta hydrolase family protein [Nakamurella endophytica]|uniref:alpha/beta hydrolase family protein n=1 Tax=Nakamurella endophytica TaxID=1748367 RepID=UPI001E3E446B|nr:alpha/beta fold hydrolase [Nakamurella endophytica]
MDRGRVEEVVAPLSAPPPTADSRPPRPAVPLDLLSLDGVRLRGVHHPGVAGGAAVVVAHGFTNATAKPSTRAVVDRMARHAAVYAVDFRGHGRSGGRASVGRDEWHDLDAAVERARTDGYRTVSVVGFSMGAAVALRHAVLGRRPADAVVSVSSPSRWFIRDSVPMRRVHWLLEHPSGRLVGRALGVRLATPWPEIPTTPLEAVAGVAPRPLLLVHGTADHYFGPQHAAALHAAAGHGNLWIEAGMTHAESGTTPELVDRIAGWLAARTTA